MIKKILLCGALLLGVYGSAICGQLSKVELTDGSIIEAEVTYFANGIYTLTSSALGQIKVPASKVRKIEAGVAGPSALPNPTAPVRHAPSLAQPETASPNSQYKAQMESMASSMAGNPEVMATIAGLATEPAFQDMLNDPEIVAKVQSGDIQGLMSNKKFLNAVNNPKIKEIHEKISK